MTSHVDMVLVVSMGVPVAILVDHPQILSILPPSTFGPITPAQHALAVMVSRNLNNQIFILTTLNSLVVDHFQLEDASLSP
ncbi:hypothetical protein C8J56DRAFT_1040036 [Mycena floridula]|nr:hypothetical protein C8J56DRAFT_1040036 [Mycena floridula]